MIYGYAHQTSWIYGNSTQRLAGKISSYDYLLGRLMTSGITAKIILIGCCETFMIERNGKYPYLPSFEYFYEVKE